MKYRLTTLVAALTFLALMGAILFLIAGTILLPTIWLCLGLRALFTFASVLAMSEDVARERLKPGEGAKPEPVYNIGTTIAWVSHIILVPLDLGRYHWSAGFPVWLISVGAVVTLCGYGVVIWALRHNEYMSARIRVQGDRGQHLIDTGPYAIVRHPNYAGGFLVSLASGFVFGSWVSILPMLLHMALLMFRTLQEEKVLLNELEGYREYAARVRWRFVLGIW
ncbi:MAG: isoprenylcysteine carboxylmethyltransferase family protein [Chloroflexota bacterium]